MRKVICSLTVLLFVGAAYSQEVAGNWQGIFHSSGPKGTIDLTFIGAAEAWSGETIVRFEGREAKAPMTALTVSDRTVSFSSNLAGADARFTGDLRLPKITGTFELFERGLRTLSGSFCVSRDTDSKCADSDLPAIPAVKLNVQRADDSYDTRVAVPAYRSKGPQVLFDEAHRNFHKTTGNFKPFADLIRNDGYTVTPNNEKFSGEVLNHYKTLVISNVRGEAGSSAFTDDEINSVEAWVKGGGSLLLIADHTPFGGFAEKLSNRFGVDMSKGYTDDPPNRDPVIKDLLFSRDNKLLAEHPITKGRNANERVDRVVSFTGQSLKADPSTYILKLADSAYDEFPDSDKKLSAAGRAQAVAFKYGKGKVVVSGEAAMLTAQLTPNDRKFGMNVAGIDNRQYALNIMHWLSGLLK